MPFHYERDCDCEGGRAGVLDFDNLGVQIDCPDCGAPDAIEIGWETEYDLEVIDHED